MTSMNIYPGNNNQISRQYALIRLLVGNDHDDRCDFLRSDRLYSHEIPFTDIWVYPHPRISLLYGVHP